VLSQFCRAVLIAVSVTATACTPHLVAPYNSELEQKATAMEAEVSAWDLTMRQNAGTLAADPRDPGNVKILNQWRGEADAMLTLIVSNDPGTVNCDKAAQAVYKAIEGRLPEALRATMSSTAAADKPSAAASSCEAGLVADLIPAIDDIVRAFQYCKLDWVDDDYFHGVQSAKASVAAPSPPSDSRVQQRKASCLSEFKEENADSTSSPIQKDHGRAISHLMTTLQVIVYVEGRKKASESK
jgi:hypothetical protein